MRKTILAALGAALLSSSAAHADGKPLPAFAVAAAQALPAAAPAPAADRFATDTAMADYVFKWAESNYSSYFSPPNPPAQSAAGYYFRAYSNNAYLAEKDGSLWVVLGGNAQSAGSLSDFAGKIGYKPTSTGTTSGSTSGTTGGGTATMSVGQAVAYEYMRAIIQWQVDHSSYTADFGTVTSGSSGSSYLDLFDIKVNTGVATGTPGFVTLKCYQCHNWKLTYSQYSAFATALGDDTYFQGSLPYMEAGDLNGYMSYTQSMLGQYNSWVAQIPSSYATYWF
jgi:hypothetical protein